MLYLRSNLLDEVTGNVVQRPCVLDLIPLYVATAVFVQHLEGPFNGSLLLL